VKRIRLPQFVLSVMAHSGDSAVVLPVLGLAWWRGGFPAEGPLAATVVAVLSAMGVAGAAKLVFRRARPEGSWGDVYRRFDPHSFPSGHAARTLALALAVLIGFGPLPGLVLVAWSLAVSLSRVTLGVHWPSDIVAGWSIGLIAGLASGILLA
jgi:membrane-associated phospholipid phosphatase